MRIRVLDFAIFEGWEFQENDNGTLNVELNSPPISPFCNSYFLNFFFRKEKNLNT